MRLTSRVSATSSGVYSGRAPAQTRRARASRKPGTSFSPSSSISSISPGVTSSSSGSATRTSVVPITETVRIGTMMSPSLGGLQRLTHVFTNRWFIAIMIPLPGTTDTTQPARLAICPAHAPDALITRSARISSSSPVSSSWARAPITLPSRSSRPSTRW